MRILYSEIKKLVPGLKATPREFGETLTMTSFMMESFEKVKYRGKKDYLIELEVTQNRVDCFSLLGLAREAAAFYGLKVKLPKIKYPIGKTGNLDIKIKASKYVKRAPAVLIGDLKNKKSPQWLVEFLSHFDMNSKNLLVDLSNYVMLLTGYPSHLLDVDKMKGDLTWAMNNRFNQITTLDGTKIELKKDNEIILVDDENILALAGVVGGKKAELGLNTEMIIAEMAVYDPVIVRKNSRSLKVFTEASSRLEKHLDPDGAKYALELLTSLILEHTEGKVKGFYDYYPQKRKSPVIKFDPCSPGKFAGIEISEKEVVKILKNLRFEVKKSGKYLLVKPPLDRMDIEIEEDIVEEVVRMYGFWKIPADITPSLEVVEDITPKVVKLTEVARDYFVHNSYDEICSWTLTTSKANEEINYLEWKPVSTQNAVNEGFPELRQSIASGLNFQLSEYLKKNIDFVNIFEVGKVFGEIKGKYHEHDSLGVLSYNAKNIEDFKSTTEGFLRSIGFNDIKYINSKVKPKTANPYSSWDIFINGENVGIIFKLAKKEKVYFSEVNLNKLSKLLSKVKNIPAVELTKKLVTLDANLKIGEKDSIDNCLDTIKKYIGKYLWSIHIQDAYATGNMTKYTIRVSYMKLDDKKAKKLHLKVFGLK